MFPRWRVSLTHIRGIFCSSAERKLKNQELLFDRQQAVKNMVRFFFSLMVKRRRKQKLASASVTTWFNQRCVCRRFHSHFLHFFFFFLFVSSVALLLEPAMCFSIWQEHDKQSISPELVHAASPNNPRMHSVSCYCTQWHVPLRKNCSNAPQTNYFQGLLKCVYSQPCKKRKKESVELWS